MSTVALGILLAVAFACGLGIGCMRTASMVRTAYNRGKTDEVVRAAADPAPVLPPLKRVVGRKLVYVPRKPAT